MDIKIIIDNQQQFFATGQTLTHDFRVTQLKKIKTLLLDHEADIAQALYEDLGRSVMESMISELAVLIEEINLICKNLKKWMAPIKVKGSFPMTWPGKSQIHHEPYGRVLIIAPWNYPLYLTFSPLIGAICAGNCAVIKPSEVSSASEKLIVKLINENFSPEFISVVHGDHVLAERLIKEHWDYIFYTGNSSVAKSVMTAAAKHLTPITLELGGKSPCIVDETADLDFTARRIVRSKYANAGQICVAPDFLLVHHSVKNQLIKKIQHAINKFYGNDPALSKSYCKIINQKHLDRLKKLMNSSKIIYGGEINAEQRYIAPTIMDEVNWASPIMQEEIFGPILPVLTFTNLEEVIQHLKTLPKPLSLYLFSKDSQTETKILSQISFGGGCINDCMIQVINPRLPFGGVGSSGLGNYHGKFSFQTFSHAKSIYKKTWLYDMSVEYPPYTQSKFRWIKKILKL